MPITSILWNIFLTSCHYYFSLPVINEDQAREALLEYVAEQCCYGSGAAKDMTFRDLKSSSAFHVSTTVNSNNYN